MPTPVVLAIPVSNADIPAPLLPVALLVAFTYFATNRAWLGFLIPSVLLFVMDFVNYFKVTLRGDPFVAEDFLTIGEGAGIIGQYTLHFPAMFFVGIALIAAGTIVLHRWARGRMPKKRWWLRVLALVLIVLLGFGAWAPVYPDWSRQPRPCVRPPATSVTDTPQNPVFPYTRFSIHAFLSFFLKKPMIFLIKLVYDSLLMTAESVMAV